MHSSAFISYLYFKFASLIRLALKKAEVSTEKCLLNSKVSFYICDTFIVIIDNMFHCVLTESLSLTGYR